MKVPSRRAGTSRAENAAATLPPRRAGSPPRDPRSGKTAPGPDKLRPARALPVQVITGGPGVGKHTAARELARATGAPIVDLNSAAAECGALDGGSVDTSVLLRAAGSIPPGAIVVGHLAPYAVGPGCRAAVLRRDPRQLRDVYRKRGYGEAKSAENCAAEVLGVTAHEALRWFGPTKTVQIDTTRRSPAETARAVSEAEPPGDEVDWLGQLAGGGELASFF